MAMTPTDVAQESLDKIGSPVTIGDLEEGTRPAQVLLRAYWQCLRQLLRAAHWNFARAQTPLVLLADATGNTPNVGTQVIAPWTYEYQWPIDAMKGRFLPYQYPTNLGAPSGNIVPPNNQAPLTTASAQGPLNMSRLVPARWLEATDTNYPVPQGSITWETQGVSPQGRTVILTNVQNAIFIYTRLMLYPSNWDVLFRGALVAYLASEVALPLWVEKDRKFGLEMRTSQIMLAKEKIQQARITDGDEGFFRNDHIPDWLRTRNTGGGRGNWNGADGGGPGNLYCGWDSLSFSDGTAY
jgi:hypothetical protein